MAIRTERITIPDVLLTCPAEPLPAEIKSQRDVAIYLIDLRAYGRTCEAQLKAVKQLQDEAISK